MTRRLKVGLKLVGASNQECRKVRPNAPITALVGIGQREAARRLTQSQRVELGGAGAQGGLDVTQGFALGQLRVGHDAKVLRAGQN